MKSLMPAVVRQYGGAQRLRTGPGGVAAVARSHIVVDDSWRIDGQQACERGR